MAYYRRKIDADLDWEDDDKNFDFSSAQTFGKNENYSSSTSSYQPVDIRKIGVGIGSKKKYCEIPYIGTGTTKKLCDNLICTKCDVKVTCFKNRKYDNTVNYMFFRSYYSNKAKLSEKTIPQNGFQQTGLNQPIPEQK